MKHLILFCFILVCFTVVNAQIRFEKGYFINNNRDTTKCYIKNLEWLSNPKSFIYKKDSLAVPESIRINSVKEFKVSENKFVRQIIKIDRSSDQISNLSTVQEPIWKADTLFLKVLLEGKATLYKYQEKDITRYFYETDSIPVTQLIYKKYKINNDQISENNYYMYQLKTDLGCIKLPAKKIINYEETSLATYFINFNKCRGIASKTYKSKKEKIHLYVFGGVQRSTFNFQRPSSNFLVSSANFNPSYSFTGGFDLEMTLPFNNKKWSVFAGPSYESYSARSNTSYPYPYNTTYKMSDFKYKAIVAQAGLRHSFFLSSFSKIYISTSFIYYFPIDVSYEDLEITNSISGMAAIGYSYSRFGIECRYILPRNLFHNYNYYTSNFKNLSFLLSVKIF